MSVNFRFCGELKQLKESENFKPFETKTFGTGWNIDTFIFQGVNGFNKHMFQIKAGYWGMPGGGVDEGKMQIYTTFQSKEEGNTKYTNTKVDFVDRKKEEILEQVPEYKKFVLDLNNPGADRDPARRREYIYEGDFLHDVRNVLSKPTFAKAKFSVSGIIDVQYSPKNGKFYKTYTVQRIRLAKEDDEPRMVISGEFIYAPESWDEDVYDDGRVSYNVWAMYYDRQFKNAECNGHIAVPMAFVFSPEYITDDPAKQKKVADALKKRMSVVPDGAQYGTIKLEANVIDGAQMEQITIDDLPDEIREDIELGIRDEEEELRRAGRQGMGERIREFRIIKANDAQSSNYEDADIALPTANEVEQKEGRTKAKTTAKSVDEAPFDAGSDIDDIFGDI